MLPAYTKTKEIITDPRAKKTEGKTTLAQVVRTYRPKPSAVVVAEAKVCQVRCKPFLGWLVAHGQLMVVGRGATRSIVLAKEFVEMVFEI